MTTKLTLRLDEKLIKNAKAYAARTGKSVSSIVADLFEVIGNEQLPRENAEVPLTQSLRGILKGCKFDEDDFRRHLEDKHL